MQVERVAAQYGQESGQANIKVFNGSSLGAEAFGHLRIKLHS